MQRTLTYPPENIYDPAYGLNCLYKGVPVHEVSRIHKKIHELLDAGIPKPYVLPYEINDGDELYDYPKHVTPEERERIERVGY